MAREIAMLVLKQHGTTDGNWYPRLFWIDFEDRRWWLHHLNDYYLHLWRWLHTLKFFVCVLLARRRDYNYEDAFVVGMTPAAHAGYDYWYGSALYSWETYAVGVGWRNWWWVSYTDGN